MPNAANHFAILFGSRPGDRNWRTHWAYQASVVGIHRHNVACAAMAERIARVDARWNAIYSRPIVEAAP